MNQLSQQKLFSVFMLLLISWVSLHSFYNLKVKLTLNFNQPAHVVMQQKCPQSSTNMTTSKMCQKLSVSFCAIFFSPVELNKNLKSIILALLILGLFPKSPIYRIYKPPKFV